MKTIFMDELVNSDIVDDQQPAKALQQLFQDYRKEAQAHAKAAYLQHKAGDLAQETALSLLGPDVITSQIMGYAKRQKIRLTGMGSFRRSLSMRHYTSQIRRRPEWRLNDKQAAYNFIDRFAFPRPAHVASGNLDAMAKADLKSSVLKPMSGAGSKNIYIIDSQGSARSVLHRKVVPVEQIFADLTTLVEAGHPDKWFAEEAIEEAPGIAGRDFKFYCFYGRCALVLEVERYPVRRYCFWHPDGTIASTGKYQKNSFVGRGVTPEQIAIAERVSANIPSPFMRVDFLASYKHEAGMVFGEFTPSPGEYQDFNELTDMALGEYFLDAEARLMDDLLHGQNEFTLFRS